MSIEAVKRDAEALAGEIRTIRQATQDHGGKLEAMGDAIANVERAQAALRQSIDAANRDAYARSLPDSDVEMGYYKPESHDLTNVESKRSYLAAKTGDQSVRLFGHERQIDPNHPQSRVRVFGLFDDPNPRNVWQRRAQVLLDRRNLVQRMLNASTPQGTTPRRAWQCESDLIDHLRSGPDSVRRIFADASGIGADWIPDVPFPELEREIMFRPSTWQMFQQVNMTRNPLVRPRRTGYLVAYKGSIPSADDPAADPSLSTFAPNNQVISAEEVAVGAQLHLNAEEDALISFESEIRTDLVDATVFAIENAIVNGDTAGTHQDAIASWNVRGRMGASGLGLSNSQLRLWLGLRAFAYDLTSMTTDNSGAAASSATILADLAKLKVEHLLSSEGRVGTVVLCSPETFFGTLIALPEFSAYNDVGLLASVITGQLGDLSRTPGGLLPGQVGFLFGRFPLIVHYGITKDLAATGLYTGSGALTGMLAVDASRFQIFTRRGSMIQVDDDPRNNTRTLISRTRLRFQSKDDASAATKSVHWRYNVTP